MRRRQFLSLAAISMSGGLLATNELFKLSAEPIPTNNHIYSANDNALGEHFLSCLDLNSGGLKQQKLSFRGHAVLALNSNSALVFGRRPAYESARVDLQNAQFENFKATPKRHFNGHGCLSANKQYLFTTETDYEKKRGIIGIRDLATLKWIGEYPSYGLDPHDLQLMLDGKTLVIANGGIETHPDFERRKLNIEQMQPSLVYVDIETGKKLAEYRLPDHYLSIRHLTITAQGDVAVALQYEGNLYKQQPSSLVAWQPADGELSLMKITSTEVAQLRGYLADVIYNPEQQLLVSTTPRGHCISMWSTASQSFIGALPLLEASGVCIGREQGSFLISSSQGGVYQLNPAQRTQPARLQTLRNFTDVIWDNHLFLV